jgi:hypothetical protein
LRYPASYSSPTVSAGLTYSEITSGGNKVLIFKSGTGTVTW